LITSDFCFTILALYSAGIGSHRVSVCHKLVFYWNG